MERGLRPDEIMKIPIPGNGSEAIGEGSIPGPGLTHEGPVRTARALRFFDRSSPCEDYRTTVICVDVCMPFCAMSTR